MKTNLKTRAVVTLALLAAFFAVTVGLVSSPAHVAAQTGAVTLNQTTLSAKIGAGDNYLSVASATGITTSQNTTATLLYIDRELMTVLNVSGTYIHVARGAAGTQAGQHASGTMVLAGAPAYFFDHDPQGYCSNTISTPYINYATGNQWLCSTVTTTWVPGFGNPGASGTPIALTTLVADAASEVTPSGPLFEMGGGTNAVTGFNIPVGCNATAVGGCQFTVIPTSAWTWTTANNIAVSGTAVAHKAITFIWDAHVSKWEVLQSS